jgi:hypothetical protein
MRRRWLAPALAVLADAAIRARRAARWACWAMSGALAGVFGAWPMLGRPGPLVPWGLMWYAPGSGAAGSHPEQRVSLARAGLAGR